MFSDRAADRLTTRGHEVVLVDARDADFFERVQSCDGFLWWFPPGALPRELGKRVLSALDHATHLHVLPDWRSCWHFDDKIAQTYLLQAAGIPMPATRIFWRYEDAIAFCRTARYPLVLKLPNGYRAENVALLRNPREAETMARRLFGAGVTSLQPRRFATLRALLRPLRNRLAAWRGRPPLSEPQSHRGSMLLQEFVPDNDFDTRVTIIGNRAFAFRRRNRPDDFRASGGGLNDYDPANIDHDAIELAYRVADTLGMPTVCVDVMRTNGTPCITELSYFYEPRLIRACPGHWLRDGTWVAGAMTPEDAVVDDFVSKLRPSTGG